MDVIKTCWLCCFNEAWRSNITHGLDMSYGVHKSNSFKRDLKWLTWLELYLPWSDWEETFFKASSNHKIMEEQTSSRQTSSTNTQWICLVPFVFCSLSTLIVLISMCDMLFRLLEKHLLGLGSGDRAPGANSWQLAYGHVNKTLIIPCEIKAPIGLTQGEERSNVVIRLFRSTCCNYWVHMTKHKKTQPVFFERKSDILKSS